MKSPTLFGVRPSTLLHLYGWRLRRHAGQELLAGSGIAVGVALVFGVLVANTSIMGSASQLAHQLVGSARLELVARSSAGFDERLAARVRTLPGVEHSAAMLRESVAVAGSRGRRTVQLVGVSPQLASLGGLGTSNFGRGGLRFSHGLTLPADVAGAIGTTQGDTVALTASGALHRIVTGAVINRAAVGALASSPIALTDLRAAQALTGRTHRITEVFVQPRAGRDRAVASELRRVAGGRLDVVGAVNELRLLEAAAKPNDQSTMLFAAIGGMVGFLLALNAMLLTVPERRRFIADLRIQGFDSRQVLLILACQALLLGVLASLLGIALGDVLSRTLFHRVPDYLAFAFPIGTQQVVHASTVLFALGCGVLATLLASAPPVFDLRPGLAPDAVFRDSGDSGEGFGKRTTLALGGATALIVVLVTLLALLLPSLTTIGGGLLAVAALCAVPVLFTALARALARISERIPGSMLVVAVRELQATATRSIALGGVAALAVYGSLAIGGARHDLIRGLDASFADYLHSADLWVTTGGNDLTTNSFHAPGAARAVARAPGVASVRAYEGALLDVGARRLWIIARPPADRVAIPPSQLLRGDLARASALVRERGWATVSAAFASVRGIGVGDWFELPVPAGSARLRVAAITTNLGWPPGAVIMSAQEYSHDWQSPDPSAFEVGLRPGVTPAAGRRAVERALAAWPGLRVQTLHERLTQYAANSREGLRSLSEISTLLLITAALAVASALSAAIWQRRVRLASLKIQGFDHLQLWRALLLEGLIVLGIGCGVGLALGVYGHALAGRWLKLTTGFPAPFSFAGLQLASTLALVAGIAMVVIALPGYRAARVPAQLGLQD